MALEGSNRSLAQLIGHMDKLHEYRATIAEAIATIRAWQSDHEVSERVADARLRVATVAMASGRDISSGQPGDGRCERHRIRGCRCDDE